MKIIVNIFPHYIHNKNGKKKIYRRVYIYTLPESDDTLSFLTH